MSKQTGGRREEGVLFAITYNLEDEK